MILVTASEMRALDEATIRGLGVPGVVLMESAGRAVVEVIAARGPVSGRRMVVVCGAGNNGGDGFVIARHLHHRGALVTVLLVAGEPRPEGDARVHFDAMRRSGVKLIDAGPGAWMMARGQRSRRRRWSSTRFWGRGRGQGQGRGQGVR